MRPTWLSALWTSFTFLVATEMHVVAAQGREIGFEETYALAADRKQALEALIPGTPDYYFFSCLESLDRRDFAATRSMLAAWIRRHGRGPRVRQIEHRLELLAYRDQPTGTFDYLRRQLGLRFDDQRRVPGKKPDLPMRLDDRLIRAETLDVRAFQAHQGTVDGFRPSAFAALAARELSDTQFRSLMSKLQEPDIQGLPNLVVRELADPRSGGFGSLLIHSRMTLPQLEACIRLRPDLLNSGVFIQTYLRRLLPNSDESARIDPMVREAYFDRLEAFVSRLPEAQNSLKAHVLYHRLEHDMAQGGPDRDRFVRYLQLPRTFSYYRQERVQRRAVQLVDYAASFETGFDAIRNDEPLVRRYLMHFLESADGFDAFREYFEEAYLKRAFAEVKILQGAADSESEKERWYSMLGDPAYYEALEKRVDIEFAPTQRRMWRRDDTVTIDAHVKNVSTLIVKVFEVDAFNFIRANWRDVDAAVDLDGLVANDEKTYTYSEPASRRVLRHFELPALDRPGVYVVELIGNGMSSRAVIQKGRLRFTERTGAAGHVFRVFDESGAAHPEARIWFGNRDYIAGKNGEIVLPFSTKPGIARIILRDGDLATFAMFRHEAESYTLHAGIEVARESLLAGKMAKVLVRPTLMLGDTRVGLSLLETPQLVVVATDLHGTKTQDEIAIDGPTMGAEFVHEIRVPEDSRSLAAWIRGKVRNVSEDRTVDVTSSVASFDVNVIDGTANTWAPVFGARASDVGTTLYHIDVLGKSGEPKDGVALQLVLQHRDYVDPVTVSLKSDGNGRVELGALDGITSVTCNTGIEDPRKTWLLDQERRNYPRQLHGVAGDVLALPFFGSSQPQRSEISFFELRGGQIAFDAFDHLAIESGYLELRDLTPGSYRLHLQRDDVYVDVEVTAGVRQGTVAVGATRMLELRDARSLQITSAVVDESSLRVRVAGMTKSTRVHVIAHRYHEAFDPFARLSVPDRRWPRSFESEPPLSTYHSERPIGDEYRYILDRRYSKKYPGNMLRRPGILLNPWALEETETGADREGFKAGKFGGRGGGRPAAAAKPDGSFARLGLDTSPAAYADLEFLPNAASVLTNLRPDDDGVVDVPLADLGDGQILEIIATDITDTVAMRRFRAETKLEPRDRALSVALDASKHFAQARRIEFVDRDQKVTIEGGSSARVTTLDSLARVYALYRSLSEDADLAKFAFVLEWPNKTPAEKTKIYSEHACHELHLFLYEKDPVFFREVVAPYLQNKAHKTFLDEWLLGRDLSRWLDPKSFGELNIVERILLARRAESLPTGSGLREAIARHVREAQELIPVDTDQALRWFSAALRSQDLGGPDDVTQSLEAANKNVELARKEVRRRANADAKAPAPSGPGAPGAGGPVTGAADISVGRGVMRVPAEKSKGLAAELKDEDMEELEIAEDSARRIDQQQRLFRDPDPTRRYIESDYWHLRPNEAGPNLITTNAFWNDFAAHGVGMPFVSTNVAEASRNFAEMMFALAVLDLPFEANKHSIESNDTAVTMQAASPLLLVRKQIVEAGAADTGSNVLVSQDYYRLDERYRFVGNQRVDAWITDEFLVDVAYGCQIVVTNPTSTPQRLELLMQIPEGAMPLQLGWRTRGLAVALQPYATTAVSYSFYFPRPIEARHYPVQVTADGAWVAAAPATTLTVLRDPTNVDTTSWEHVSQNGSPDDVFAYLENANILRVDLSMILWRLREREFFDRMISVLDRRHHYDARVWAYGLLHEDEGVTRQYLTTADNFVAQCGPSLDSPILVIDPIERKTYKHVEYEPLFNPRAHRWGQRRAILNADFATQYAQLLTILCYRPLLDSSDWMSVTYYLLLQDRVQEAMAAFARVDVASIESRVQYDYMRAYLDFFSDDHAVARGIAEGYADYPVDRWRIRFQQVIQQLDEAEGASARLLDPDSREAQQGALAAKAPHLDLVVEAMQVRLQVRNLETVEVNYYEMDVESLFSAHPFMDEKSESFAFIKPNLSEVRDCSAVPSAGGELVFDLPAALHNKNVLVEVRAAGLAKRQAYYANSLIVQVAEGQGQLAILGNDTKKPLPKAYVKVFARLPGGAVRFHKDGYSDLRGRFDYASLSGRDAMNVDRFAILVLSEDRGAVIREVDAPAR
ncbi:MAG: hypothetical protein H6832_00150 [Planctomycetes bacterium]|nr:hypothetical protein [Planctomycetota bacterium]MCB9916793.1 hypothetical protein [Planctomycetota bacterium]